MAQKNQLEFKFVGRDQEFKQLNDLLKDVLAGKGQTVFISGEAGIGKTRLVTELQKVVGKDTEFLISHLMTDEHKKNQIRYLKRLEKK